MLDQLPSPQARSPYKLLEYYVEGDAKIFGGREQEIFDITARLASRGLLVLFGPSGIGKTSLILAGILPAVRALGWRCVYVRTLLDPLVDLATAVAEQLGLETDPVDPSAALVERMAVRASKEPVLIALDQFEEFFIRFQSNPSQKEAFIDAIVAMASRGDIECRVLFSLREDYLGKFDEFRRKLPQILENSYRVGPLSAFGAREAITRPLLHQGIPFDHRLVADLLDHLVKFGFDPAILQIICGELVRVASDRNPESLSITSADLGAIGGIEGVFDRYLDKALSEIPAPNHLLARLVLDALIAKEQTKHAARIEDFLAEAFVASSEELSAILNTLHKYRIVRRDTRGQDIWFELMHERLVPIVQHWIRADLDYFSFITARDLVEYSSRTPAWHQNPEVLLNKGQIEAVIQPYVARLRLDTEKIGFLLLSCTYRSSTAFEYWAKRYGVERTAELLLTALSSPEEQMRVGATVAVRDMETAPSSQILQRCFALSLDDPSESVRRLAGAVLGHHGREREFDALRKTLARDDTRERALQVYADVLAGGRPAPMIGRLAAFRAQRILDHRQLRKHRDLRTRRGRWGALHGIAAGVVWSITIAPLWLVLYTLARPHSVPLIEPLAIMGVIFPIACVMGGLLGRSTAMSAARRDIIRGKANWGLDLGSCWVFWGIIVIYLILTAVILLNIPDPEARSASGITVFSSPIIYWIAALLATVAIAQGCVTSATSRTAVILWGSATAAIIPVIVAAGALYSLIRFVAGSILSLQEAYGMGLAFTLLGTSGALICLASLTLPRFQLPLGNKARGASMPSERPGETP